MGTVDDKSVLGSVAQPLALPGVDMGHLWTLVSYLYFQHLTRSS
jgi:hypothetical protein